MKLVVVGDSGCGKTSLLIVASTGQFPVITNRQWHKETDVEVDDVKVELALFDTAGMTSS